MVHLRNPDDRNRMRSLQEYRDRVEALQVELAKEQYNQYAGLPYSEARMEHLSAELEALAREALERFPREGFSHRLFYGTIKGSRASDYTRLENRLYKQRNDEVAVQADGETVSLSNVRVFNRRHIRDAGLRKRVFDGLMGKARALTPTLAERFGLSRELYRRYRLTPLDVYLDEEQITLERLVAVVDGAARRAKPGFEAMRGEIAREVLGKELEYYDDFYVLGSVIFEAFDPVFAEVDFIAQMNRLFAGMGFDLERVSVDGQTRPGKYASPVCFGVHIPQDVRVLYQETSPFDDFVGFCHEMGHALHFASVDPQRPYEERYLMANGVAEIFSTLFESIATDPRFLREELGLDAGTIADLKRKERFMELFYLTFYGANSMLKIRFWQEDLSIEQADALYEELCRQYMGFPLPGVYWETHHVISMSDLYAPSYLLAKIRMEELKATLVERFGGAWWRSREAGTTLRERFMGPGAAIALEEFSKLDGRLYLDRLLRPDDEAEAA